MAHPVLASGAALLTAAGYVWYVPAVTDLAAGDDRPRSVRLAALACVTWWLGVAAGGLLSLLPTERAVPAAAVLTGAVLGTLLRSAAAAGRRAERRAAAGYWTSLGCRPLPAAGVVRPQPAVAARLAAGLVVATAVTAAVLLTSRSASVLVAGVCAAVGTGLLTVLTAIRRARP